ncbi:hypothetical protein BOX15_Mlig022372g1, partial [Macrostomum lignano]|uniref:Purine nucleoside phosphorylase n=3 Tax=Macrostomum lignano TaxID=282301 RepID=A0A1I8I2I4_9PLAT
AGTEENSYERAEAIARYLLERTGRRPELAVVLGSGLGGLGDSLTDRQVLPYAEIPGFPTSTVAGHQGNLIFGKAGDRDVVLMQGRFHAYEGYSVHQVTLPMRVFHLMGVRAVLLTNAAGGLNRDYAVGDVMLIRDHLNLPGLVGCNPLRGPNDERLGPRFPSTSDVYDKRMRDQLAEAFKQCNFPGATRLGVYVYQQGPCYESVAECRMLITMGADAVGMSTVPEAVVAHHAGLRVCAFSLITNMALLEWDSAEKANHEEVLQTGQLRADQLKSSVSHFLANFSLD